MQNKIGVGANGIGNVVRKQLDLDLEGIKERFDISEIPGNDCSLVIWTNSLCVKR